MPDQRSHRTLRGRGVRRDSFAASAASVLLALALASSPGSATAVETWQPANGERLHYRILDGDKPVGDLRLRFSRTGDALVVEREQNMSISRLMLKATLHQASTERWTGDRFAGLSSKTELTSLVKNDAKTLELARAADGSLSGQSTAGALTLPGDALPMSLWRGAMLHDGLYFDPGEGKTGTISVKSGIVQETAPPGTAIDSCKGVEIGLLTADKKKSRAILWIDPAGKVCSMRFISNLGNLDYAPVVD